MQSIQESIRDCLDRELLIPAPFKGVYWSPAVERKLERAGGHGSAELGLGDFLIGSYTDLADAKAAAGSLAPGCWVETEIHHIVENFHLQFLGVVDTVSGTTYKRQEPCALLATAHHNLVVENAIGIAQQMVMEARPFDFVSSFAESHPGISRMSRTRQGVVRANWMHEREGRSPGVSRNEVREVLLEVYRFAYQEPDLHVLRLIAERVIRGMAL